MILVAVLRGVPKILGMGVLALSCAGTPRRVETAPPRIKDSGTEKQAAMRAAAHPSLQLDREEERWGIEAAREREGERQEAEQQKRAQQRHSPPGQSVHAPGSAPGKPGKTSR